MLLIEQINWFFQERLKDSTRRKYKCVTSLCVRHDVTRYKISRAMSGSHKALIFQRLFLFNDLEFYDEQRKEDP